MSYWQSGAGPMAWTQFGVEVGKMATLLMESPTTAIVSGRFGALG